MTITGVQVRMLNPEGRMRAVASVTFDAEFVIHDIRIIEGHDGLFVAMPSRRSPGDEGGFRDIAHPTSPECRDRIQAAVLAAYRDATAASWRAVPRDAPETDSARAMEELHALVSGQMNILQDEVLTSLAELAGRKGVSGEERE